MSTQKTPFSSILIANRGEIACRIIHTAKLLGLRTIAVYSEADAQAPHVMMADDSYCLGPAPVAASYLDMDKVLEAATTKKAEAIHPGYGFLSENADFATACTDAGLIFIGPTPKAIELMGDKAKAKRRMIDAGVPCVPGYQGEEQSDGRLIDEAAKIGFPIMVKAAAGGGGRGMRLVEAESALATAITAARSEAENAFGSGELILEKAISQPRHVEIQVFADKYGNTIHLGERDCSVQRRHQKVLEEAPCPVMTPELRQAMGNAAVKAAKDIAYVGAGTVEFLLDASGEFYFLEMNTRLQVEHPVTEMVTGLDLVALQIRVAQGDELGLVQKDVALSGHAIEARLYAEDTSQDFLPATGPIDLWQPASGAGIRIDSGISTGGEVSPFYDPMLAKIIAYGDNREEARRKLIDALKCTVMFGATTNKAFLIEALERPAFVNGAATTAFIGDSFSKEDLAGQSLTERDAAIAAVLLYTSAHAKAMHRAIATPHELSNWSSATKISTPFRFAQGENGITLNITPAGDNTYHILTDDQTFNMLLTEKDDCKVYFDINGEKITAYYQISKTDPSGQSIYISIEGCDHFLTNAFGVFTSASDTAGAGSVTAPMHGMLLEVFVSQGDKVKKGDRLAVVEAMKMQHELLAEVDGEVADIHFEAGVQVAADSLLMEITVTESS
ncbi:acetyl-CoA carboxylase biotin carboxylase subunit [Parvularcula sp. IMCC14364]|uniref:acetyl/propionyl/methylcrotonyl-CoA carboxylase subunit alpha n=1 Tax=Parvularcula sp. IMCC14364 TaxID=3067902 RepID=UPI002742241B|nr:acetyl-CoA carboxylase biotin carboxylase subunit [Parvularcula sp. IMCC14364]